VKPRPTEQKKRGERKPRGEARKNWVQREFNQGKQPLCDRAGLIGKVSALKERPMRSCRNKTKVTKKQNGNEKIEWNLGVFKEVAHQMKRLQNQSKGVPPGRQNRGHREKTAKCPLRDSNPEVRAEESPRTRGKGPDRLLLADISSGLQTCFERKTVSSRGDRTNVFSLEI